MVVVNPDKLVALQRNPEGIRNVSGIAIAGQVCTISTDLNTRFAY